MRTILADELHREQCRVMSGICAIAQARPDAQPHVELSSSRTHDGRTLLCADARIDAQPALRGELARAGHAAAADADDADLILHAWAAWREQCVGHLLGDFAFVIWDPQARMLFAARDHWGVKPFFYAAAGGRLVASNIFETVLAHPAVDGALDETWIGDFLLFGGSRDAAATVRASVRRLPPAHCMTWTPDKGVRVRRYWSLPDEWGMPSDESDPVERLKAVLTECVADRIRGTDIGIELSGGLDSSSVAAVAHGLLTRSGKPFKLEAQTLVYDHFIDSNERRYAGLVAQALGIRTHFFVGDDPALLQSDVIAPQRFPEPVEDEEPKIGAALAMHAANIAPVFLTGWDGDALLDESPKPYLRWLWKSGRHARAMALAAHYAVWRRRIPLPFRSRAAIESREFPEWLNPDFVQRAGLRERWSDVLHETVREHPIRPQAYRRLDLLDGRLNFLEGYDPGRTGCNVEYRHPMLDLRFVRCALSLPPTPWCVKKEILRRAMTDELPAPVTARAKEPWPALLHQRFFEATHRPPWPVQMDSYADARKVPTRPEVEDARPLWLARWLATHR